MKKRKGPKNPRKFNREDRKNHAKRWLMKNRPNDLLAAYAKKYGVSQSTAQWELEEIGFRDEIAIQLYEKDGIEWEYKYGLPLSRKNFSYRLENGFFLFPPFTVMS